MAQYRITIMPLKKVSTLYGAGYVESAVIDKRIQIVGGGMSTTTDMKHLQGNYFMCGDTEFKTDAELWGRIWNLRDPANNISGSRIADLFPMSDFDSFFFYAKKLHIKNSIANFTHAWVYLLEKL